jgi:hypothetical protein
MKLGHDPAYRTGTGNEKVPIVGSAVRTDPVGMKEDQSAQPTPCEAEQSRIVGDTRVDTLR